MSYRVNEIFTSLQGEGARAGSANTFLRFSGCNLQCRADGPEGFDCDTEFTSGVTLSVGELVDRVCDSWDEATGHASGRAVILTGGEPMLQADSHLVDALKECGFFVAVETNGTQPIKPGVALDWVSCSPKTAEHTLRIGRANELRYVRNAGQGIPKPSVEADSLWLSPAALADGTIDRGALANCIALCLANPAWRLSVQQHKAWRVR